MIFLKTERLVLRNVLPKDIDVIFDYRNHELCAKYQRGQEKDREKLALLIERRGDDRLGLDEPSMLAVALSDTDEIIGEIIVMPNEGTVSLGYTFSYRHHRRGYAYEALSALIGHLHTKYPHWDFVCFTDPRNAPSMRLLEKLGYTDMGYLRSRDSRVFGKYLRPDSVREIAEAVASE